MSIIDMLRHLVAGCRAFNHRYQTVNHLLEGRNMSRHSTIEECCDDIGWSIDERNGDTIGLYFNDKKFGPHRLKVSNCDGQVHTLYTLCNAAIPARKMPSELLAWLLVRNGEIAFGKWQMHVDDDDDCIFVLSYTAFGSAFNGATFKHVCEKMIEEAHDLDAQLQKKGLL